MIILSIVLLSILAMLGYYLTAKLRFHSSVRHVIDVVITLGLVINVYRVSQLFAFPWWGQWIVSFGMMLATLFGLFFIRAIIESVLLGGSAYFVDYFRHLQYYWTHLWSIAHHDFWELVEICIYDPNDPHTWDLFGKGH